MSILFLINLLCIMKILTIYDVNSADCIYLLYDEQKIQPNDIKHYLIDASHNGCRDSANISRFLCDGHKFTIYYDQDEYSKGPVVVIYKDRIEIGYNTYCGTVYFDKAAGNCVDTFLRDNVDNSIRSIRMCANEIQGRLYRRATNKDYRNSTTFENDMRDLSDMKRYCEKLANKCSKMIEHMTML